MNINSESITVESEGLTVCEIVNCYGSRNTEYFTLSKQILLPLMSEDMKNPNELLNRIKKFIIFS